MTVLSKPLPHTMVRTLAVSILSLGRPENVLRQLAELPTWLAEAGAQTGTVSHIVVRNNDPGVSFADVAVRLRDVAAEFPDIGCTLVTDVPNNGFGAGHNTNIALVPSDYVLILNDDIGFPHMAWLTEALAMMDDDPSVACVACEENPRHVNPLFGNGQLPGSFHLHGLTYGEASVLACRRTAFDAAGGFHEDYAWAMCEDADLSLRFQQLGYRIAFLDMPHQHWRSTSFNSLPGPVKSSILEHNRAALFANWRESFASGQVGRIEIFDVWSDGLGDVMCALPHLLARLTGMTDAQRSAVIVNTSHPELFGWLGLEGIRVQSEPDIMKLRASQREDGVATLRSTREANFSLPFNIHPLLAGTLGVAPADAATRAVLAGKLAALRPPSMTLPAAGSYAVVHLEFDRTHEGRALSPAAVADLLTQCGQVFKTVVLVGREHRLSAALCHAPTAKFVDLQGKLSLTQLAAVIARAGHFVGIDSFPSHVAQACGVPAAIFFGAIHPLTRAWQARSVWPLVADLPCLGCYHTQLEPSVPFCMRRDQACTSELPAMRSTLTRMIAGEAHDWSAAEASLQALQSRMIKLTRFHPAPPERLFRGSQMPNETASNMIYRMLNQVGDLVRGQYQTTTVNTLLSQTKVLQSDVFAGRVQLDEAQRELRRRPAAGALAAHATHATRIVQLSTVALEALRCTTQLADQWIEVEAFEDDPQLLLPLILGGGGKVQLRLSCVAEPHEAMQIFWALGDAPFSLEHFRTVTAESSVVSANIVLDVPDGETLRVRIDPITGRGRSRLHGSIGGDFVLLDPVPAPPELEALPPAIVPVPPSVARRRQS